MKVILILLALICYLPSNGQLDSTIEKRLTIDPAETYIVLFEFDSIIHKSACNCAVIDNSKGKCYLLKGRIKEIIFMGDTSIYNKEDLLKLTYIVVPRKMKDAFISGNNYVFSAYNSTSKLYLIFNKFRDINERNHGYYFHNITGLIKCYRQNILQRIHLQKMNYSNSRLRKDKIENYIINKR